MRVTGQDWARLGPDVDQWAHFIGHRAYLRMAGGSCAALRRTEHAGRPWYVCAIYDRRPQACRDLDRGSPACDAERERKQPVPAGLTG